MILLISMHNYILLIDDLIHCLQNYEFLLFQFLSLKKGKWLLAISESERILLVDFHYIMTDAETVLL